MLLNVKRNTDTETSQHEKKKSLPNLVIEQSSTFYSFHVDN